MPNVRPDEGTAKRALRKPWRTPAIIVSEEATRTNKPTNFRELSVGPLHILYGPS